ncbi:MAG TPA: hypothetical protein V6D05_11900 [Stenomitos sp.]
MARAFASATRAFPSFSDMLGVYEVSIHIRRLTRALLDVSDDMALLATNAEITADRSRGERGALTVIANEAKRIAHETERMVSEIRKTSGHLERESMAGVLKARAMAQYLLAHQRTQGEEAQAVLDSSLETAAGQLQASIIEVHRALDRMGRHRQAIDKLNDRSAIVATYFRIEASRDEAGNYFHSIASMLDTLYVQVTDVVGQLLKVLGITHQVKEWTEAA